MVPALYPLNEVTKMSGTVHNETERIRLCHVCGGRGLGNDRFCRRCGVQQTGQAAGSFAGLNNSASLAVTKEIGSPPSYATAPLAPKGGYQSFSGPLVKLITESVTATKTVRLQRPLEQAAGAGRNLDPDLAAPHPAFAIGRLCCGQNGCGKKLND